MKLELQPTSRSATALRRAWLLGGSAALLVAGCTVGPDYHRPSTRLPAQWNTGSPQETNAAPAALAAWWKTFGDAELESLIFRALGTNLDLQLARERLRAARAQQDLASSAYWPTLDGSASYTRERLSQRSFPPFPPYAPSPESDVFNAGFDASWEIDIFGGHRRSVEAAGAQVAAQVFSAEGTRVSVTAEVARNYLQYRALQQRLEVARASLEVQREEVKLFQDRVNQGLATALSLEQARSALATIEAQIPGLQTSLKTTLHRLCVLLTQTPEALQAELDRGGAWTFHAPVVPAGLPSDLLLRRPDIRAAERQVAAANAQVGVAKADLFPKFYLTGLGEFSSVSARDWFVPQSRAWSISPSVQWRIFDAGKVRANIRAQTSLKNQALISYQQVVLNSLEDVENALVAYGQEQEHHRSLLEAHHADERAVALNRQLFQQGVGSYFGVLDAERTWNQSRDQLIQSEQTVALNLVSLYKALGGGWATEAFERFDEAPARSAP